MQHDPCNNHHRRSHQVHFTPHDHTMCTPSPHTWTHDIGTRHGKQKTKRKAPAALRSACPTLDRKTRRRRRVPAAEGLCNSHGTPIGTTSGVLKRRAQFRVAQMSLLLSHTHVQSTTWGRLTVQELPLTRCIPSLQARYTTTPLPWTPLVREPPHTSGSALGSQ